MSVKIRDVDWKSLLPEVYTWTDKVKLNFAEDAPSTGITVVGCKTESGKKEIVASQLSVPISKGLLQTWEKLGWSGKSGNLCIELDGRNYVLVPMCQTKTSAKQLTRQFGIDAAKIIKEFQPQTVSFAKPTSKCEASDLFDGICMGLYDGGILKGSRLEKSTKKEKVAFPETLCFVGFGNDSAKLQNTKTMARAITVARTLQDAPPNWLTPQKFADVAAEICAENSLKLTVLGRTDLEKIGAGSFLSVAGGSPLDPKLIAIEIGPKDAKKTVALIGKGLTFDSGGISIKPSQGMGEMKYDMSGGAAVLGAAQYLAKNSTNTRVICIIGAVENMVGPGATRPGDIVCAMNGKTIDIQNTDAEGRLVLADLLHYAIVNYKPDYIVDIATLTGAVLHALGHAGAAVMSNDDDTANMILDASKNVGEPFWQLPLWPELDGELKGENCDLQNIAKPNVSAGTIIGGVFLQEFVGTTKWAHLDIAGTAWSCKATGFSRVGGSAYGLRTMVEFCNKV